MSVFITTSIILKSLLPTANDGKYDFMSSFRSTATFFPFYKTLYSIITEFDLDSSVRRNLKSENFSFVVP